MNPRVVRDPSGTIVALEMLGRQPLDLSSAAIVERIVRGEPVTAKTETKQSTTAASPPKSVTSRGTLPSAKNVANPSTPTSPTP